MAASATLALKAGACVRRTRLVMVAPDPRHPRRSQAEIPLIDLPEFGQPPLSPLAIESASTAVHPLRLFSFRCFRARYRTICRPARWERPVKDRFRHLPQPPAQNTDADTQRSHAGD